jgi:hypothetical protein
VLQRGIVSVDRRSEIRATPHGNSASNAYVIAKSSGVLSVIRRTKGCVIFRFGKAVPPGAVI